MLLKSLFVCFFVQIAFSANTRNIGRIQLDRQGLFKPNEKESWKRDEAARHWSNGKSEVITFLDEDNIKNHNKDSSQKWSSVNNNNLINNTHWMKSNKTNKHDSILFVNGGSNSDNNNGERETTAGDSIKSTNVSSTENDVHQSVWNNEKPIEFNEYAHHNGMEAIPNLELDRNKNQMNNMKNRTSNRSLLPQDSCGADVSMRILGGTTADIDEFPWMALIQYRDRSNRISHDCGGALISSRYVITAAHCILGLGVTTRKLKVEKVRLGEWDLATDPDCQQRVCSKPVQDIEIEHIINHEDYNPRESSQKNDISLIRLREEAEINQFVQPICLPLDGVGPVNFEDKRLYVAGWGRTANVKNSNSNIKMKVQVPVVSWDNCRSFYQSFYENLEISKSQMCAGGENGKDTCQGDSGSPLMATENIKDEFRWIVIGLVSSGPAACGVEGRPSLYTKVSHFTEWILRNIRQ